eukprot:GEMP01012281.1.p1 GENE.GEMP01012281.1~~GEMP01012281.1.p1  ORF type:complete len:709 (+),score=139.28 GEMP01012281.1:227-2353(+)
MLLYNNRGSLRIFIQLTGSVFQNVAITTSCLLIYVWVLVFMMREGYLGWLLDYSEYTLRNAYAPQAFGVLSAFAVCFRTNIAWSRYWEACAQTTQMFVKWVDAYAQIVGFCNTTIAHLPRGDTASRNVIIHWKCVLVHWFSLLAGFATERLMNGDISAVEDRDNKAPWRERVIRREHLHALIHNASSVRNLPNFHVYGLYGSNSSYERHTSSAQSESSNDELSPRTRSDGLLKFNEPLRLEWKDRPSIKAATGDSETPAIPILIELSDDERKRLVLCGDRVLRVYGWVIEGASYLQRYLDTPPPIFSRVYQELGSGNLGFHQALKLADVPFPFIFTQLLAWMLFLACLLVPIFAALLSFQSNQQVDYITMVLSVLVCIPLVGLNEMAKELENPFGMDANDVPLMEGLECFVESLVELYFSTLPIDLLPLSYDDEKAIHQAMASKLSNMNASSTSLLETPIVKLKGPVFQSLLKESHDKRNHDFLKNLTTIMDDSETISSTHLKETVRKVINASVLNYKDKMIRKSTCSKESKADESPAAKDAEQRTSSVGDSSRRKSPSSAFHAATLAISATKRIRKLEKHASASPSDTHKSQKEGLHTRTGTTRISDLDPEKQHRLEKRKQRASEEKTRAHSTAKNISFVDNSADRAYRRSVRSVSTSSLPGAVESGRASVRDDKSGRSPEGAADPTTNIIVTNPTTGIADRSGRRI